MIAAVASVVIGCGGGERQDAGDVEGEFPVEIVRATFPALQHLAETSTFEVTVRNAGDERIPNVAVTLSGFTARSRQPGLSSPVHPRWIVDSPPRGGVTAYDDTWALGALASGATRTFRWQVTPVVAGTHRLRYRVAAGLDGKARAVLAGEREGVPRGSLVVRVEDRPAMTRVDPRTGQVRRDR